MELIPVSKKNKNDQWVLEYIDKNDGLPKDLIIRSTEAEIDEIANTVLTDTENNPLKDEDGNVKTMIYPAVLV